MDATTIIFIVAAVVAWGYFSWVVGFKMCLMGLKLAEKYYPFKEELKKRKVVHVKV